MSAQKKRVEKFLFNITGPSVSTNFSISSNETMNKIIIKGIYSLTSDTRQTYYITLPFLNNNIAWATGGNLMTDGVSLIYTGDGENSKIEHTFNQPTALNGRWDFNISCATPTATLTGTLMLVMEMYYD